MMVEAQQIEVGLANADLTTKAAGDYCSKQ